jgi:hypothetical protein
VLYKGEKETLNAKTVFFVLLFFSDSIKKSDLAFVIGIKGIDLD